MFNKLKLIFGITFVLNIGISFVHAEEGTKIKRGVVIGNDQVVEGYVRSGRNEDVIIGGQPNNRGAANQYPYSNSQQGYGSSRPSNGYSSPGGVYIGNNNRITGGYGTGLVHPNKRSTVITSPNGVYIGRGNSFGNGEPSGRSGSGYNNGNGYNNGGSNSPSPNDHYGRNGGFSTNNGYTVQPASGWNSGIRIGNDNVVRGKIHAN